MASYVRLNVHALLDWSIATGRSGLASREALLARFDADPLELLGDLLTRPPTRAERVCPLLLIEPPPSQHTGIRRARRHAAHRSTGSGRRLREVGSC